MTFVVISFNRSLYIIGIYSGYNTRLCATLSISRRLTEMLYILMIRVHSLDEISAFFYFFVLSLPGIRLALYSNISDLLLTKCLIAAKYVFDGWKKRWVTNKLFFNQRVYFGRRDFLRQGKRAEC